MATLSVPGFAVFPLPMVVVIGEIATFHCSHMAADNIGWRVGNTSLGAKGLPGVNTSGTSLPNGGIAQALTINATRELNGSAIQCIALIDGSEPQFTIPVTLNIQGILDPVEDLTIQSMSNNSIIAWNSPFSLNLSNVEPDVIYCVDIFNITCGKFDHLISDCSVLDLNYTFLSTIEDFRYIYAILLTPRSNIENARNGTSLLLQEEFMSLNELSPSYSIEYTQSGNEVVTLKLFLYLDTNVPNYAVIQPSVYVSLLESDDNLEESRLTIPTIIIKKETVFVFQLTHLIPFRRLWHLNLLAYGCLSNPITTNIYLSTHDFQNVSIYSQEAGKIVLSGYFINRSRGAGVLFILFSPSHDNDVLYIKASRIENQLRAQRTISGLTWTSCIISVYVLDEAGLPFERTAIKPRNVSIIKASQFKGVENAVRYKLQSTSTSTCITCTFLDKYSTTDCVAVVHQRISQLSSSGLMNIESSHKFNRSGDTAYGCIEGVNLTHYQVGVIGGVMDQEYLIADTSFSSCTLPCYVTICIILALIIIGLLTAGILYRTMKQKAAKIRQHYDQELRVTMRENKAYEVISMACQRVKMDTNPAYEEVQPRNMAQ